MLAIPQKGIVIKLVPSLLLVEAGGRYILVKKEEYYTH